MWQVVVIAAMLVVARALVRSPRWQHTFTMMALLACVLWPILSTQPTASSHAAIMWPEPMLSPSLSAPTAVTLSSKALPIRVDPPSVPITVRREIEWRGWATLVWALGIALLTLRQGVSLWALRRWLGQAVSIAEPELLALLGALKQNLRLHRVVRFAASAQAKVPMVIGTLRPVVLLPLSVLAEMPMAQLEALIAHELAHLKRWDDVANLLQCLIETLLFFHPLVWWMSRCARHDRELCADDLATRRGIEPQTLALALGHLALDAAPQTALAATGGKPVLSRIQRLLQPKPIAMPLWPWLLIVAALITISAQTPAKAEAAKRGRILSSDGVVLAESTPEGRRRYPQRGMAAHVIGHASSGGKTGLEESMNDVLSSGKDVTLTLDTKMQALGELVLQLRPQAPSALAVVDVRNGDVLCLASSPGYDLNEFVHPISSERWHSLTKDPNHPLVGRALINQRLGDMGRLVTVLAGLHEKKFKWTDSTGTAHDLPGALLNGSNRWFDEFQSAIGTKPIMAMGKDLGLQDFTGLPLPEREPSVPTFPFNGLGHGMGWKATPLHLAIMMAAIGNEGKVFNPRLDQAAPAGVMRADLSSRGISFDAIPRTIQGGTSRNKGRCVFQRTMKNALSKDRWLSWAVGLHPAPNRQIAFAMLVEGAEGEPMTSTNMVELLVMRFLSSLTLQWTDHVLFTARPNFERRPSPRDEALERFNKAIEAREIEHLQKLDAQPMNDGRRETLDPLLRRLFIR